MGEIFHIRNIKSKSMPFAEEYNEVFQLWWITRLNKEYYIHREEEDIDAATAELTEEGIEWLMK